MQVWRLERFKSLVGQTLLVSALESDSRVKMKVVDVIESNCLGEKWESFSVVFGFKEQIQQGSYQLEHDDYGKFDVFISPNSESEAEAVFNYELAA